MTNPATRDDDAARDADYFRARARDELRRTRNAASDRARQIHREMASHYSAVARALDRMPAAGSRSLAAALRQMLERIGVR